MSHSKKSKLKVVPVKRYNRAKYPSFHDPNPIDHPDTLPYPFSEKVFKMLCTMGFTGALLLSSPDEAEAAATEDISLEKRDTMVNPFTEKMTGLPYMPASFGTGLPSRLRREESIAVINRVFREEGVELDSMVNFEKDGVTVTANGYNEEMKLGYVYIGYNRYGEGTIRNNGRMNKKWEFNETYKPKMHYPSPNKYKNKNKYSYKSLVKEDKPQNKSFVYFIDNVYPTLGSLQKKNRFERAYLTFKIHNELDKIAPKYPVYVADIRKSMENPDRINFGKLEKIYFTLGILRQTGGTFPEYTESEMVRELIRTVDQSDKKWGKQMNNIHVLIGLKRVADNEKNTALLKLIKASFAKSGKAQQDIFKEIESTLDFLKIDLWEIQRIDIAAEQNRYFLAPISQRDYRFTYKNFSRTISKEDIKIIEEQIDKITDPVKRENRRKWIERKKKKLTDNPLDPKTKSLKLLEEQVRNYIHWAKSQMGY